MVIVNNPSCDNLFQAGHAQLLKMVPLWHGELSYSTIVQGDRYEVVETESCLQRDSKTGAEGD